MKSRILLIVVVLIITTLLIYHLLYAVRIEGELIAKGEPIGIRFRVFTNPNKGVCFEVDRWYEKRSIQFYDFGFNGTLDLVIYWISGKEYILYPNSIDSDWNNWEEKYLKIRKQATEGN
ncbi:hypothetical protein KJ786_01510 [Patescibacteria group bacterium]|nr:hypothetical protein [Patescibacteria group bacterium]